MHIPERLIVPGLGVVILLASFILGVPLVYEVILGLLGLAAAGTYFMPQPVQVEIRVAVAALGLLILLIATSAALWLTLLSFAAIGALQLPHRQTLQRNPATIAWLSTVLKAPQTRRAGRTDGGGETGEEAGAVAGAGDGARRPQALSRGATLPGFVRVNVAGIGGSVAGVIVLVSVFLPWVGFLAAAYGELAGGENLTLRAGAEELGLPALSAFFFILLVVGVLSIISIGLPRAVTAVTAAAGFVVTLASYLYVFAEVERETAELSSIGLDVTTIPAVGALLAGLSMLVMFVLQLIPGLNGLGADPRSGPQGTPKEETP